MSSTSNRTPEPKRATTSEDMKTSADRFRTAIGRPILLRSTQKEP